MRLIGFRARYVQPILASVKTTTIRPADGVLPRVGETVGLRCRYDRPPFAYAVVDTITPVALVQITDRMATADGHADRDEMVAAVEAIYPERELVLIRFRLVETPALI